MKTYEIDFTPVAVLKENITDRYPSAKVCKVKRYASFIVYFHNDPNKTIYCGTPEQLVDFAKKEHLSIVPKNARGRKFFDYTVSK